MVLTAIDLSLLSWKAGYSDELSARFGGGWAETCSGNWKTRRPSILYPQERRFFSQLTYTRNPTLTFHPNLSHFR